LELPWDRKKENSQQPDNYYLSVTLRGAEQWERVQKEKEEDSIGRFSLIFLVLLFFFLIIILLLIFKRRSKKKSKI
jgi:hypothetical protein